jgi:CubicO group peptidase (beta-lactamase class C family)
LLWAIDHPREGAPLSRHPAEDHPQVLIIAQGLVDPQFEPVREAFAAVAGRLAGTGAAVAVWYDGAWVVDLWGSWADGATRRLWQPDSIVQPYSVSKPFAAMCALALIDRRRLELDAAVRRYWPEFRAAATVRQLLSHQSGVVALDRPAPTDVFYDWDGMCALLAEQEPAWAPGSAHGESALFFGHLVGELVRGLMGGRWVAFCARRSAARSSWTSRSGWIEPSRPGSWTSWAWTTGSG